jgi:hypothetical protein
MDRHEPLGFTLYVSEFREPKLTFLSVQAERTHEHPGGTLKGSAFSTCMPICPTLAVPQGTLETNSPSFPVLGPLLDTFLEAQPIQLS